MFLKAAGNILEAAGNILEAAGNILEAAGNILEAAGMILKIPENRLSEKNFTKKIINLNNSQ